MAIDFDPTKDLDSLVQQTLLKINDIKKIISQIESFVSLSIMKIRETIRPPIADIIKVLKNI